MRYILFTCEYYEGVFRWWRSEASWLNTTKSDTPHLKVTFKKKRNIAFVEDFKCLVKRRESNRSTLRN